MDVVLRRAAEADVDALLALDGRAFGVTYSDEAIDDYRRVFELDRMWLGVDGPDVVAEAGAWTFALTVPGGGFVPAAGVTFVAVSPSHRRRGIMRSLMVRLLDDAAERDEPVAVLGASESTIYGRFGYGIATFHATLLVDPARAHVRRGLGDDGLVRFADPGAARRTLPEIYERLRQEQPATLSRHDRWWDFILRDRPSLRDGATAAQYIVHPDGYAWYRLSGREVDGHVANRVIVRELVAVTPEAYASLWNFLLGIDLVAEIEWSRASPGETLRWIVDEPRRVRTHAVHDDMWVRLVDVAAALGARRYSTSDRLVIEVVDDFRPGSAGRYELDGSPDGASCRRTTASPDLVMGVDDLGSVYLGGVAVTTLARAGRVAERTPGAVRRASALFVSDPPPHNQTSF